MKKHGLLVIVSTTQAKVYEVAGREYRLTQKLKHSQSRLKNQELISDRSGHYQTCHKSRGQYISSSNPHEEERIHFAKIICDFLNRASNVNHHTHIILCAEPHFYGLLKKYLSKSTIHLISKVVQKDYIPLPQVKLNKVIEGILHEPF